MTRQATFVYQNVGATWLQERDPFAPWIFPEQQQNLLLATSGASCRLGKNSGRGKNNTKGHILVFHEQYQGPALSPIADLALSESLAQVSALSPPR
jgi:hypothetical protein